MMERVESFRVSSTPAPLCSNIAIILLIIFLSIVCIYFLFKLVRFSILSKTTRHHSPARSIPLPLLVPVVFLSIAVLLLLLTLSTFVYAVNETECQTSFIQTKSEVSFLISRGIGYPSLTSCFFDALDHFLTCAPFNISSSAPFNDPCPLTMEEARLILKETIEIAFSSQSNISAELLADVDELLDCASTSTAFDELNRLLCSPTSSPLPHFIGFILGLIVLLFHEHIALQTPRDPRSDSYEPIRLQGDEELVSFVSVPNSSLDDEQESRNSSDNSSSSSSSRAESDLGSYHFASSPPTEPTPPLWFHLLDAATLCLAIVLQVALIVDIALDYIWA